MKPFFAAFILCCLVCAGRAFAAGSAERKIALPAEKNGSAAIRKNSSVEKKSGEREYAANDLREKNADEKARAVTEHKDDSTERTGRKDDAPPSASSSENAPREKNAMKIGTGETTGGAHADGVKSPEIDGTEEDALGRFSRDGEGRLKAFAFDAERFTLSDANGESVTVNASGKKAVRNTYDALMRPVKRDVWKIASTAKESALERSETFYYNADGAYPASSIAESEGRRSETLYDDEGRVISFTDFFVDTGGTLIPDTKMTRRYTDGNKILEEEKSRCEYADEKKSRLVRVSVQKKTYDYGAGGENPNYYFYEDGKLRIKTIYAKNDEYVTTLYFDDGYTVISEYDAGNKIRETIKNGDRVLRTKNYDTKN